MTEKYEIENIGNMFRVLKDGEPLTTKFENWDRMDVINLVEELNKLNDENKELKDFNHYLIKLEKELRQERNQLMNPLYLWVDKKIRQLELKIDEAEGYKFLQLQYQSKIEVLKELREELQE